MNKKKYKFILKRQPSVISIFKSLITRTSVQLPYPAIRNVQKRCHQSSQSTNTSIVLIFYSHLRHLRYKLAEMHATFPAC